MSKRLIISLDEIVEPDDITNIGKFAQEATDAITVGALGWPNHWSRVTVSKKQGYADVLVISPGEFYNSDKVFSAEAPIELNIQAYKPILASDERILGIIARGDEVEIVQMVDVETSAEPLVTSEPIQMARPKLVKRVLNLVVQQGTTSPAPALAPAINENDCCLAFVTIKSTGIVSIVANEANRVKPVFEIEGRMTELEIVVEQVIEDTVTLRTDLANVAAMIENMPDQRVFTQVVRDTARHSQRLNLPEEARNYYFDDALVKDFWDLAHADSMVRIQEGLRFSYQNQFKANLRVLNTDDPEINIFDQQIVLPKYTEVLRISSPEGAGSKDISNVIHTVTTAKQNTVKHTSVRYGETVQVCENAAGWNAAALATRKPQEIFAVNGQTFVSKGLSADPWNNDPGSNGGHKSYAVQRAIVDTSYSSYVTYDVKEFPISGAIYGQTFLCAQVMVATSIELNFKRVGSVGDVLLNLCEIRDDGAPDYKSVLAKVNKPVGEIDKGWNKFTFPPTLLEQGKRYGWFTVTTGNHQLMTTMGFTGGTMFTSTDGLWQQGSLIDDFSFKLNAAKFAGSRTVIPMYSINLDGGMTEIQFVYRGWEPAATKVTWEVKALGDDEWTTIDGRPENPLANLPPLVQLRAVLLHTEDVAPSLILDNDAVSIAGRPRSDMRAISDLLTFGFTTTEAQVVVNMDNFDPARHTASPKVVLANGTIINPLSTSVEVDSSKPSRRKITANFDLGAATGQARVRLDATTNTVVNIPFGQDIQLNAF